MKIMVCENCGKHIHRDAQCFHCGGTGMYPAEYELDIHPAAQTLWQQMQEHLTRREFDRALALSERALEWMGFTGELYWLRLLARQECATDRELLLRGADPEHSSDYFNAIKYAGAEEHQVYLDIQEKLDSLRQELLREMERYFLQEKQALNLADAAKNLHTLIYEIWLDVSEQWNNLNQTEAKIQSLASDCRMVLAPHLRTLEKAQTQANTVRQQVNQLNACSEEEYRGFQLRLAAALQTSEETALLMGALNRDHPWQAEFARLKEEQAGCLRRINEAMDALNRHVEQAAEAEQQLRLLEEDRIRTLAELASGDFRGARRMLGEQEFNRVLAAAGIAV